MEDKSNNNGEKSTGSEYLKRKISDSPESVADQQTQQVLGGLQNMEIPLLQGVFNDPRLYEKEQEALLTFRKELDAKRLKQSQEPDVPAGEIAEDNAVAPVFEPDEENGGCAEEALDPVVVGGSTVRNTGNSIDAQQELSLDKYYTGIRPLHSPVSDDVSDSDDDGLRFMFPVRYEQIRSDLFDSEDEDDPLDNEDNTLDQDSLDSFFGQNFFGT
ncbi:unnamed protein product [Orchesella dallaii]|uniref:Uncharacterized protein n=1 Tax=Orchesella dallaii TaxID=48710 RepID=A0ABP1R6P0_9HEXA